MSADFASQYPMSDPVPEGANILVLEDDVLTNTTVSELLREAGCTVTSCTNLREAWAAVDGTRFDGAVLDLDLGHRQSSYEIADTLEQAGVPFVFLTGYLRSALPGRWTIGRTLCRKPFVSEELKRALGEAMAQKAKAVRSAEPS
jgi:CheY-like chemotaxis protein